MTVILLLHRICSCIEHMAVMFKLVQAAHCDVYCAMCCTKTLTTDGEEHDQPSLHVSPELGMQMNNHQGTGVQRSSL